MALAAFRTSGRLPERWWRAPLESSPIALAAALLAIVPFVPDDLRTIRFTATAMLLLPLLPAVLLGFAVRRRIHAWFAPAQAAQAMLAFGSPRDFIGAVLGRPLRRFRISVGVLLLFALFGDHSSFLPPYVEFDLGFHLVLLCVMGGLLGEFHVWALASKRLAGRAPFSSMTPFAIGSLLCGYALGPSVLVLWFLVLPVALAVLTPSRWSMTRSMLLSLES